MFEGRRPSCAYPLPTTFDSSKPHKLTQQLTHSLSQVLNSIVANSSYTAYGLLLGSDPAQLTFNDFVEFCIPDRGAEELEGKGLSGDNLSSLDNLQADQHVSQNKYGESKSSNPNPNKTLIVVWFEMDEGNAVKNNVRQSWKPILSRIEERKALIRRGVHLVHGL